MKFSDLSMRFLLMAMPLLVALAPRGAEGSEDRWRLRVQALMMTCHASELSCSGGCWECIDGRLRLPAATLPGGAEAWHTGLH